MTHRTTGSHDQTAAAIACSSSSASIRNSLAALLDLDDIVCPELRNASILGAQRASQVTRRDDRNHHTLASGS